MGNKLLGSLKVLLLFLVLHFAPSALGTGWAAWPEFTVGPPEDYGAFFSVSKNPQNIIIGWTRYDRYEAPDKLGLLMRKVDFRQRGADGEWDLPPKAYVDDVVSYEIKVYEYENRKISRIIRYSDPGINQIPLIDDTVKEYEEHFYDQLGDLILKKKLDPAGELIEYSKIGYNPEALEITYVKYIGKGPDDSWFAGDDDTVGKYQVLSFSDDFKLLGWVEYVGSGPNGTWFDHDDVKKETVVYTYEADCIVEHWTYELSGDKQVTTFYLDADKRCTRIVQELNGTTRGYVDFLYDSRGRITDALSYYGPGSDSIWFTPDDYEICFTRTFYYKVYADLDGDGENTLKDVILALQMLSGVVGPTDLRPDYATAGTDVNNDGRIGFHELLYSLQVLLKTR